MAALTMLAFLDDIYGTLFLPHQTLTALKEQSTVWRGALVVALVNLLEGLRSGGGTILLQLVTGLGGWYGLCWLLERLGHSLGKEVNLDRVLTLTGFASLPWLFFAPALNLGGGIGVVCGLAVVLWFVLWQLKAVAIALELQIGRVFALIPLAFAGTVVAFSLLFNGVGLLLTIGDLF
ncbi:MAG: hypothetical protein RMK91_04430 [Pseudanabaenaceae cyanobacterium SKYGB_i_bin29]|nr:hypothetical protein [Pseudanabaenaceae cyanobacterium SKYG29]MDW8421092.1 hypothetical protein [Pseudanabaenaceae cyanobacterium SKYGB_i_bin29]